MFLKDNSKMNAILMDIVEIAGNGNFTGNYWYILLESRVTPLETLIMINLK
jgi:hypothetical protein